ncbi:MAG: hypothetical protein IT261_03745, partial [Saprospiraceae bacterium]|nr:hypothetical protein [Saprospiraceae bacterium]
FPGGMGEFHITANSGFLGVEKGPSVDVTLQWATYRDASDQTSLSRIWGGIHPPEDDIPGRRIGAKVGINAFEKAKQLFYFNDADQDGYPENVDCNDTNAAINPNGTEGNLPDGLDNDCNGVIDDFLGVPSFSESFSIFPNPVRDQMTIRFGQPMSAEAVYMLDQQGRVWQKMKMPTSAEQLVIDFTTAPAGIYGLYVVLEDGRRVWLGKAMKW